jgi:hypothetical protein
MYILKNNLEPGKWIAKDQWLAKQDLPNIQGVAEFRAYYEPIVN